MFKNWFPLSKKRNKLKKAYLFLTVVVFSSHGVLLAQGNYRLENFGNKSILLNGNVTGTVSDLGLSYYNPARLGLVDNPSFAISAKAFELSNIKLENTFGNSERVKNSNFNGIPTMVAGTFEIKNFPKDKFAYSFISRYRNRYDINYSSGLVNGDFINGSDGNEDVLSRANINTDLREEWIGLTWAKPIKRNFSVGASLFLSIYNYSGSSNVNFAAKNEQDNVLLYDNTIGYEQKTYGLFLKLAAAWKSDDIELGFNFNLPHLKLLGNGGFSGEEILSGTNNDIFNLAEFGDLDSKRRTALGASLGAGFNLHKNKIHANIEWYNGVEEYERLDISTLDLNAFTNQDFNFNESLKPVVNFGVGAEIYLNDIWKAYSSFSTDYSAYKNQTTVFNLISSINEEADTRTNYWHYGLGLSANLSWASFVSGAILSTTSAEFANPIDFPSGELEAVENEISKLSLNRWRFIVGVEIPLFVEKIEKTLGGL
ncbi:hypothetical protein [Croceitalea sp. P059]|uniref:hypothetical protein n=1 Tax=Croceitalea sp. P059 TaxID=3075601 RepID=UPI00288836AB|nr:hypothetical protein [Croceitalea sp. P059]MDT0539916.1 hypothetical protein [Croceitalea sp. P059]